MRQAALVFLLFLFSVAPAFSFTGQVVGVLDGDSMEVLHNGKAQRVRLYGIDCPEKGQAFRSQFA
jgi:micrococcal nuclease